MLGGQDTSLFGELWLNLQPYNSFLTHALQMGREGGCVQSDIPALTSDVERLLLSLAVRRWQEEANPGVPSQTYGAGYRKDSCFRQP